MLKKRVLSLILMACVLWTLLPPARTLAADLFFIAVNDTVPGTMTSESMPFWSGSTLYIPHTAWSIGSVGVVPAYDIKANILTLFSREKRLVFDLEKGTVTDENGVLQSVSAMKKNGLAFVPAVFSATHFNLSVSYLSSKSDYPILRFKTGSQVYEDALFVDKAENLISYRVEQYRKEQETTQERPNTPEAPSTQPSPSTPLEPTTPPTEGETNNAVIYLIITGGASVEENLTVLNRYGVKAAFFLTAEELAQFPELVLRICAQGHVLGIDVPAEIPDPASYIQMANERLDAVLQEKSLFVLVTAEQAERLDGYCATIRPKGVSPASVLEGTRLFLCDGSASYALYVFREAKASFRLLRETTPRLK